jgi:hypothetical protein
MDAHRHLAQAVGLAAVNRRAWDDILWDNEAETGLSWIKVYVGGVKVRQYGVRLHRSGRVGSVPAAERVRSSNNRRRTDPPGGRAARRKQDRDTAPSPAAATYARWLEQFRVDAEAFEG